ncbi:hypothetical protein CY35_08G104000 [Sphagnum magellanicum]|nr:hypothetical protein CY35_08G104000 [Sphagnum magellanicum]
MEAAATAVTPPSLREQGNALFKEKNYLKTAAVYTQAIKADPENAAVYRCLSESLADAEMAIKLRPTWKKGYFREGCALEAMECFEEALATYHEALKQDPQSANIAGKIESLTQPQSEKVNGSKSTTASEEQQLDVMLQGTIPPGTSEEVWSSVKELIETSIKEWNDSNGKVDPGVCFCAGKDISKFSSSCCH